MAETLDGRARSRRARQGRRAHPRRRAEPPLSRGRAPHCARAALRRDRRAHQRSRRFFPRAAFRRVSRGDGSCPAARHGDPRLRRPALHDRTERRQASIAGNGTRRIPGIGRARRRRRSSNSRTAPSSSIAAPGARQDWARPGNARGASSARKGALTWDGADQIRIEVLGAGARNGLFDPLASVEPPPLAPEDRDRRAFRRSLRFRLGGPLGERARDRRARQHPLARDGLRRHRERGGRPARRHRHLNGDANERSARHPHRNHDPGQRAGSRRLRAPDRRTRLREHRAVLLADDEQGPAAAGASSFARRSATPT